MMQALNETQRLVCKAFVQEKHIVAYGSAGTGKTYLSLGLALSAHKKVIIVRSAVPTRSIGFLPGTVEEKMSACELPYIEIAKKLGFRYSDLKQKRLIEFTSTSYIRSLPYAPSTIRCAEECTPLRLEAPFF